MEGSRAVARAGPAQRDMEGGIPQKRLAAIAAHVVPELGPTAGGQVREDFLRGLGFENLHGSGASISTLPCSSGGPDGTVGNGGDGTSPSINGGGDVTPSVEANKYGRIHGSVPRTPAIWQPAAVPGGEALTDVIYEKAVGEGIAKITINRPERRNAFRPETVMELIRAFNEARDDPEVGVIVFTGKGSQAFCSGGDQAVRQTGGYVGKDRVPRLNVLDLQMQIRRLPKPVIAMVAGYAVGGGHVLHLICDITIAGDNAIFGQTGPKVGSFDAGYGCSTMARLVGQKKAREMWFLARFYTAQEALQMGLVNTVVPLERLEEETVVWCREMLRNSPMALRLCKSALNAVEDGHAGLQELAGNATLLFYHTEEGSEGRQAFMEGRAPNFSRFKRLP